MSFLEKLTWRYAAKKFDKNAKISPENLEKILSASHLAPSSYGIQPYKIVVVENAETQEKLQSASYNQPQIGTASAVLVFVARTDLAEVSEEFFAELSGGNPEIREKLAGYEKIVNDGIANKDAQNAFAYASEQAHISLGFSLAAAAELGIDSCAIGGFDATEYAKILNLPENEIPCVVLPLGYRDVNETPRPKFRKSKEKFFTFVK